MVSIGTVSIWTSADLARSNRFSSYSYRRPSTDSSRPSSSGGYPRSPVWVSARRVPATSRNTVEVNALPKRIRSGTSGPKSLAIGVGAHHHSAGHPVPDVPEPGPQRGTVAAVARMPEHGGVEGLGVVEHVGVGRPAAVVDHHDRERPVRAAHRRSARGRPRTGPGPTRSPRRP